MAPQSTPSASAHKPTTPRSTNPLLASRSGVLSIDTRRWSLSRIARRLRTVHRTRREPVNKALLIGIQYEDNEVHPTLSLPHSDVEKVKRMLIGEYESKMFSPLYKLKLSIDLYKFDEKNIIVLMDKKDGDKKCMPTRNNIVSTLHRPHHPTLMAIIARR